MSCPFFPYHQFIDHINKTDIVLTSSSQLAEDIIKQYTLHKLSSNTSVWDTPNVYSWRNWLKALHFNSHRNADFTLLNQGLSVNILQNFIDDAIDNPLIKSSLLASNFYENLNLMSNLCIPHSEIEKTASTDDEKLFSKVIINYKNHLNDMSWLDMPSFYNYALENIKLYLRNHDDNTKITFVGFDDPLPIEGLLIQEISKVNYKGIKWDRLKI